MLLIRSIIFTVLMVLLVPIFVIPGVLITLPLSFSGRYRFYNKWAYLIIWLLKVICNLRHEVEGLENIPSGSAIIYSKHQSMWETIALQTIFPPQLWVLKRELLWLPFFGWALALMGSIGIDRGSGRSAVQQIVKQGKQRLDQGRWIVIFPEGTRVAPGQKKRYGIGGAILAEESGYPLVPVAHNAGEFWPRRGLVKRPGVIKVVIGPVIKPNGKSASEMNKIAEQWIEGKVEEITTLKADSSVTRSSITPTH
jgi:1-acyl-sn-glycerol-3-phosphate acyltransferase